MQTNANALMNELQSNGGFTYALDGSSPKAGDKLFAVAYSKDTERTYPLATFTPEDLVEFITDYANELALDGVHLGAWVDGETVYLDCSLILDCEAEALRIGYENNQLAIFCFENMESKCTGLTSKAKS